MKATFSGETIAESDKTVHVQGADYFPPEAVNKELLKKTEETYTCPSKGEAVYYDVVVGDRVASQGAWAYHDPKEGFEHIAGWYGFWNDVEVGE